MQVLKWQKVSSWLEFVVFIQKFKFSSLCYRYEDSENSYQKYLEYKPGDSNAEKELSQLHQAKSALESALNLYESKDIEKALEYVDKVVLVFSPACSKVLFFLDIFSFMAICNRF